MYAIRSYYENLYLAVRVTTIDRIIETTPNEARYYVGYVAWQPGELTREIERGLWAVLSADLHTVFRKDTDGLWEELLTRITSYNVCYTKLLRRATSAAPGPPRWPAT